LLIGKLADWQIGRLADWQIGRLADWQIGRVAEWQIGRLADWQMWQSGRVADWQIGRLADWQIGRLADWQIGKVAEWQIGRLADWQIGRLADWQIGRLADWQIGRLADWQIGRLADWQIGRLADWQIGRLADWQMMADWQIGRLADWQIGRLADWQIGRLADGRLADWQIGRLADWQIGRLADWQTGRLADWQTGRLADWQTGRLADWQTGRLADWQTAMVKLRMYLVQLRIADFGVFNEFGDRDFEPSSIVNYTKDSNLARALDFGDTPREDQIGGLDYDYGQLPALDSGYTAGRWALDPANSAGATRNKLSLHQHTKVGIDSINQRNVGEALERRKQLGQAYTANSEHERRSSVGGEIVADRRQWLLDVFKGKEKDGDKFPSTCASSIPPTKIDKNTIAMFGEPVKTKSSVRLRREQYERKLNEIKAAATAPKLTVKTQWDHKGDRNYRKSIVVKTTE
jgi:hypothetical protein